MDSNFGQILRINLSLKCTFSIKEVTKQSVPNMDVQDKIIKTVI